VSSVGRLLARPQRRRDDYVLCPEDRFWFRPTYTDGTCPLCGAAAPGGAPPLPLLRRMDRSRLAMVGLTLESLAMLAFVVFMYFKG
jgi:hypothetical protein